MLRFGTAQRRGAVHIPHIRAYLFGALRLAIPADFRTTYAKGAKISAWGGVCEMRHCERQRMNHKALTGVYYSEWDTQRDIVMSVSGLDCSLRGCAVARLVWRQWPQATRCPRAVCAQRFSSAHAELAKQRSGKDACGGMPSSSPRRSRSSCSSSGGPHFAHSQVATEEGFEHLAHTFFASRGDLETGIATLGFASQQVVIGEFGVGAVHHPDRAPEVGGVGLNLHQILPEATQYQT